LTSTPGLTLESLDFQNDGVWAGGGAEDDSFPSLIGSYIGDTQPVTYQSISNTIIDNRFYGATTTESIFGNLSINKTSSSYPIDVSGTVNASQYCISAANCISSWPGISTSSWSSSGTALYYNLGPVSVGNTDFQQGTNFNASGTVDFETNDYLNATGTAPYGTTSTTIQISTTTGLSPSGFVAIGNEIAYYSSVTASGTASTLDGMVRGLFGTPKQNSTSSFYAVPFVLANSSSTDLEITEVCSAANTCGWGFINQLPSPGSLIARGTIESNGGKFYSTGSPTLESNGVLGLYSNNQITTPGIELQTNDDMTIGSSTDYGSFAVAPSSTPYLVVASTTGDVGIGVAAPSTTLQVTNASSTIRIGSASLPGCLEMGNSDGTVGINYITVLNGALTATTTKPSNCQ
jgi:hypothetical protein